MLMPRKFVSNGPRLIAGLLAFSLLAVAGPGAAPVLAKARKARTLAAWEFIGTVNFPTGYMFAGTQVGGLSSITYDKQRRVYHALSDDQGTVNPVRFYTLTIDVSDGTLDPGDIEFVDVTTLKDKSGAPYAPASLDPEGFVLAKPGQFFMSSEGFNTPAAPNPPNPPIPPFVNRYNPEGRQTKAFKVPGKFLVDPARTQGVRQNLGFESLNVTPDRKKLVTASEGALAQDGPAANIGQPSLARILEYDLDKGRAGAEYVYVVNPVADVPVPPTAFRVNGLVELLPLDNAGTMLAMERSFSVGVGNTVHLYEISTEDASDVSRDFALGSFTPVDKRFILDVRTDLGLVPDNLEGMAFGPKLSDGRQLLILVSDNNFDPAAVTQFIALAVRLEKAH